MILSTSKADTKKKGLKVWNVSGPVIKTELYRWLKMERVGEEASPFGWCHFPEYAEEYFKQLTSERQVIKISNGYPKAVWEKDPTRRNEALDCRVYARAAAAIYGLDRMSERSWQELEALIPLASERHHAPKPQRFIQMQPTKVDDPWL
jgi:phage terminase large subunit GpA-like protein